MTGPNQPREACGCIGCWAGELYCRDGFAGLVGDAGGRAGVEYEREPRLPPLPARANASLPCRARISMISAGASAQRNVFVLRVISAPPPVILAVFAVLS
jgi:hypothetical protein